MKKLSLVLCIALVISLLAFSGCGSSAENKNDEDVNLTVWYWGEQEIPGYQKFMEEAAKAYSEATEGVSVEVVLQESDTLVSALRAAEAGGQGPDLGFLWGGSLALDDAWLGNLDPIDQYMTAEELACMDSSALAETNWDGKQWGFPAYTIIYGIAYNKDMFRAAGLDPDQPIKTFDEFVDACEALKAAGYTPIGSGLKDGYLPGWLAVYFGAQNYDDPNEAIKPFKLEQSYTDSQCSEWIYLMEDLIQGGYFNDDIQSLDFYQGQQLLETESCAMTFQVASYTATIAEKMGEDKIGFMQAPVYGTGALAQTLNACSQVYVMPKSAKHKEAAADFLLYLASADNQKKLYEMTNAWMPVANFDASIADNKICADAASWMSGQKLYSYQYTYPSGFEYEGLVPIMQQMFTEGLPADQAVAAMDESIQKWAEQNPNLLEAYKKWSIK